jgi:hypothetical protein
VSQSTVGRGNAETAFKALALINDRERDLWFGCDAALGKLMDQAGSIDGFEQAWAECPVNLDRGTNDLGAESVFHGARSVAAGCATREGLRNRSFPLAIATRRSYVAPHKNRSLPMNLDAIAIGNNPPEDVNVIVEVAIGGEPIKYEMDKDAGTLVVDRFLYTPMRYPGNYGFVPHTLSDDGDPIDVLVANTRPIIPGK